MKVSGTVNAILESKGSNLWWISPGSTVFDAIQVMAEKNVGALLVMEADRLVGVISERDYTRKVALKGKSSKGTAVREILSTPVITVTPESTVEECLRLMTHHRIRHLPVVAGGMVVGLVPHRDILRSSVSSLVGLSRSEDAEIKRSIPVRKVMRREVATIGPDEPAAAGCRQMLERKIGCLPVVEEGGRLVGIVTEADFLQLALRCLEGEGETG
jgi:CBS domain-containing protein